MFKKLFVTGIAAGVGYLIFSNPEMRKKLLILIERGKIIASKAIEEAMQASEEKQLELSKKIE